MSAGPPPVRMNGKQRKKVITLIRRLCANCDDGRYCLLLDDGDVTSCPQMLTYSLCCRYFKDAVLPADGPLCAELLRKDTKPCANCGAPFYPKSNRAMYCPRCAVWEKRKKAAARKRRQRERGHALGPKEAL